MREADGAMLKKVRRIKGVKMVKEECTLMFKKEDEKSVFYRYECMGAEFWFDRQKGDKNIYAVYIRLPKLEYNAEVRCYISNTKFYPEKFEANLLGAVIYTSDDACRLIKCVNYLDKLINSLNMFFKQIKNRGN